MLSENPITVHEFQIKVKEFAQALINKVSERFQDATLRVIQESPRSFLIIVNPKDGDQITNLKLGSDGLLKQLEYMEHYNESYLITIVNGHKSEHYQLSLSNPVKGIVESESVYIS